MVNRLEPLNLRDFTGGLNLRRNQFQLAANESPEMLNVEVDPRGGFFSRKGWRRWNDDSIAEGEVWDPRSAFVHTQASGTDYFYLTNEGSIWTSLTNAVFSEVAAVPVAATPHLADFVAWGDDLYVACGKTEQAAKRSGVGAMAVVPALGAGSFNDDYTAPVGGRLPKAEFFEAHSGYLFAANIQEGATDYPNRIRWSHPLTPEDWATDDFFDIEVGGSRITGIVSFNDHMLVFKTHSVWAIYGYDRDSWQRVAVSEIIGTPGQQCITRSESAVFFFAAHDSPGVFAYDGQTLTEISEPLRRVFEEMVAYDKVWMGWVGHRLWVSLPWSYVGPEDDATSVFVFDPTINQGGAWVMHSSLIGCPAPYFNAIGGEEYPLAVLRSEALHAVVQLENIDEAYDQIEYDAVLVTLDGDYIITVGGDRIKILGFNKSIPRSIYRTPWLDADWPTRKKSWRRSDFVCREYGSDYRMVVEIYRDHIESKVSRSKTLDVGGTGTGTAKWGEFDWGDGTVWGASEQGATIVRGATIGLAKAVQMRFVGPTKLPNRWGVDAVVMKYVQRRFR